MAVPGATFAGANLSYDEKVAYFTKGTNFEVWRSARASATSAFPVGALAPGTPPMILAPAADETERVLFAQSGQGNILRATRASTTVDWGTMTDTGVAGVDPFVSRRAVYYTKSNDIYASPTSGGGFGNGTRIDEIATAQAERWVVASGDDLELVYRRGADLVFSRRASLTAPFDLGTAIPIGTMVNPTPAGLSEDRCRLYVNAEGAAAGLFVLTRPQ